MGKRLKPSAIEAALADRALAVYSGQDLLGWLLDIDGTFHAYNPNNCLVGVFGSMKEAARALPNGKGV